MKRKYLLIGLWIVLTAFFVVAGSPSIPSNLSPDDNSHIFDSPIDLTCSGFTDPDGDNTTVEFYENQLPFFSGNESYTNDGGWTLSAGTGYSVSKIQTESCGECIIDKVFIGAGDVSDRMVIYDSTGAIHLGNFSIVGSIAEPNFNLSPNEIFYFATYDSGFANVNKAYKDVVGGTPTTPNLTTYISGENNDVPPFGGALLDDRIQSIYQINLTSGGGSDLIGITTGTTIDYNTTIGANNTWTCRACDNNSDCSNYTTVRTIFNMNITPCDSGNIALNISFVNESNTAENLSALLDELFFDFTSDDTPSYTFINTSSLHSTSYQYCLDPSTEEIPTNGTIRFSLSGFPLRQFYFDDSLNGSILYNQTLYLLSNEDGIYTTFIVGNEANAPIEGALVIIEKQFGTEFVRILGGYTDSSGSITFWVDPDDTHRITSTANGFSSYTTTLTPSQSSYTITMGAVSTVNITNLNVGVTYLITPTDTVLTNNTEYNFGFNITSAINNLTSYGFDLVNSTNDVLASISGTNPNGSYVNQTLDTNNYTEIRMNYYYEINSSFHNGTNTWQVRNTYKGTASLQNFFDDLRAFSFSGFDDFGRAIFIIMTILLIVGLVTFTAGITWTYAILGLVVGLVGMFEYAGIMPELGFQGGVFILTALLFVSYWIYDHIR